MRIFGDLAARDLGCSRAVARASVRGLPLLTAILLQHQAAEAAPLTSVGNVYHVAEISGAAAPGQYGSALAVQWR